MTAPNFLSSMQYQAPGLGYFPILRGKVKHLITWGLTSQNMSGIVGPDKVWGESRTQLALSEIGITTLEHVMRISPDMPSESQIQEITQKIFTGREKGDEELETGANFIYTTDPSIGLIVKPGDCPVAIIYTRLSDSTPLLGLLHAGRKQLDDELPRQAVAYLKNLGCNMKDIWVGIAPSIQHHHTIPLSEKETLHNFSDWEAHKRLFVKDNLLYLDALGYFLDQLEESGISAERIQAYTIDTYVAASESIPEGFSHRYAKETHQPEKNGRFLVAAQLP